MKYVRQYRTYIFLALAGLAIVSAFGYLAKPQGHIPPLDANRWRLAESQLEGYCAGVVTYTTGKRDRNPAMAEGCRADNAGVYSEEGDMEGAVAGFCVAISEGLGMSIDECRGIVAQNRIWPLFDGGFTMDWNDTFPYPGDKSLTRGQPNDRVGERETIERDEEQDR